MAKPKLALIPAAQGTKFYSVLPSDGSGDFTFTRGSVATRINAQGLIENVASGQSRLDYPLIDGVQKGCPHHILEPARTNLLSYSADFLNAYWTKSGSSITSDSVISPDGTLNADKLVENSDTVEHFLRRSIAVPTGQYTWSVFAKASERKYIVLRTNADGGAYKNACFDVELGVVVYDGLHNSEAKIEAFSNGWFRISGLSKETSGTTRNYQIHVSDSAITDNGAISYNGDGISGIYLYGVQLELGYRSSYIPTTSTAVTRSAETATGAGQSSTFNDSEGVLMVEIASLANSTDTSVISISNNSVTEKVLIALLFGTTIRLEANMTTGSDFLLDVPINLYLNNKVCIQYKANQYKVFINGISYPLSQKSTTPVGLLDLSFDRGDGTRNFNGNVKQVQYFDSILADTQLEQLTSWQSFRDMAEGQLYTIE